MKVIRKIKSNINHSSDGVKGGRHRSAGATVTSAGVYAISRPNSIRGVINKCTPRTASLVLLPSLAVLAMFIGFSSIAPSVYADDDAGTIGVCTGSACPTTSTESTTFSIEDEKTIGITLSSEAIVLDISPTSAGVFKSKSFTVDVSTNNPTGYTLTMTADKTDLSRTSKINNEIPTIPTIPTGKTFTEANFETGYWGYKLGTDTGYLPMTTSTIPVNTTEAAANSSTSTITFASKLDNSTPAGTYDGVTLSFVATANEVPDTAIYMQELTNEVCQANASDAPLTVVDKRDNNEYRVRYINGNCWMVDNLKVTGTVTAALTNTENDYTIQGSDIAIGNDSNGNPTAWYNYTAATAGTLQTCQSPAEDICPAGWMLARYGQLGGISNNAAYIAMFEPVAGGYYNSSTLNSAERGFYMTERHDYWSSSYGGYETYQYDSNSSEVNGYSAPFPDYYKAFMRCMKKDTLSTSSFTAMAGWIDCDDE